MLFQTVSLERQTPPTLLHVNIKIYGTFPGTLWLVSARSIRNYIYGFSHIFLAAFCRKHTRLFGEGLSNAQALKYPIRTGRRALSTSPQFLLVGRIQRRHQRHDVDASYLYAAGLRSGLGQS